MLGVGPGAARSSPRAEKAATGPLKPNPRVPRSLPPSSSRPHEPRGQLRVKGKTDGDRIGDLLAHLLANDLLQFAPGLQILMPPCVHSTPDSQVPPSLVQSGHRAEAPRLTISGGRVQSKLLRGESPTPFHPRTLSSRGSPDPALQQGL